MKSLLVISVPSLALSVCTAQQSSSDPVCMGQSVALQSQFGLHHTITRDHQVRMELTYPGNRWLGLGYSHKGGRMVDSIAIVGVPLTETVRAYHLTSKLYAGMVPVNVPSLTQAVMTRNATHSILRFTHTWNDTSLLTQDGTTLQGGSTTIIYAAGADDSFGFHYDWGSSTISLTPCVVIDTTTTTVEEEGTSASSPSSTTTTSTATTSTTSTAGGESNNAPVSTPTTTTSTVTIDNPSPTTTSSTTSTIVNPSPSAPTADPNETTDSSTSSSSTTSSETTDSNTGTTTISSNGTSPSTTTSATVVANSTGTLILTNTTSSSSTRSVCALSEPATLHPGLTLHQGVDSSSGTFTMQLVYEGQSWLSVGMNPTGRMVGALAVIGWPVSKQVFKYELQGKQASNVIQSEAQTLMDSSIVQNDTHTVLTFTKFLKEPNEPTVNTNGPTTFIYAVGVGNMVAYHSIYGAFTATLSPCGSRSNELSLQLLGSSKKQTLLRVHGWFMAAAWGILVPIAIGSSLMRDTLPEGVWFTVHLVCNGGAVLLTTAAFALAVRAMSLDAKDNDDHFRGSTHRKVGLAVFLLALVQTMVGFMRPRKPTPSRYSKATNDDNNDEEEEAHDASLSMVRDGNDTTITTYSFAPHMAQLRRAWEIGHRCLGVTTLSVAWYACYSGMERFTTLYGGNTTLWIILFWVVAVTLLAPTLVVGIINRYEHWTHKKQPTQSR
jgi:hypothetical protein